MPPKRGKKKSTKAALLAKAQKPSLDNSEGTSANGVEEESSKDEQVQEFDEKKEEVQNEEIGEENKIEGESDEDNADQSIRASKRPSTSKDAQVGEKKTKRAKRTAKISKEATTTVIPKIVGKKPTKSKNEVKKEENGVNVKQLRPIKRSTRITQTKSPANTNTTSVNRKTTSKTSSSAVSKQFEVESILDMKKKSGKRQFLVKWKGYTSKENTWEPEENLNCPRLLSTFLKKEDKTK